MSKTKAGPVNAGRLKSFIERIERLEEERSSIGGDIKDVYSKAKGVGYDVKTMRKVVALRKMDAADRDEQEALLDTYLHALETVDRVEARVAAGEPITRATEAEGYSRATFYRVSQRRADETEAPNETPHDPVTGEIKTTAATDGPLTSSIVDVRNLPPHTVTPTEDAAGGDPGHAGGSHESGLNPEPEVARVVPPVTDPLVAMEEAEANWQRLRGAA